MANLTTTDKQILEKLFAMGAGLVLNFSDKTFAEFFRDDLKLDIHHPKYRYRSGSKANRMRGFWLGEDDKLVAKSIDQLLIYIDSQIALERLKAEDHSKDLIDRARSVSDRLAGRSGAKPSHTEFERPSQHVAAGSPPATEGLKRLQKQLLDLHSLSPQERGFAFERFLGEVFELYQLAPRKSFRLVGEQIDGSFQLGQDVYLIEAKWQSQQSGQSDLLVFSGKVEGKAQWSRGVFISYSGFTQDGLEAFAQGKSTSIVCMDGFDLHSVLTHPLSLAEVIASKVRWAAETNAAYVSTRELFPSKIL